MRRSDLTNDERSSLIHFLLEGSSNGTPAHGRINEAMVQFNSGRRTISRIWSEAKKNKARGELLKTTTTKWHPRKKKSRSTVSRWIKKGMIRAHTSAIKHDLTIPNKLLRMIPAKRSSRNRIADEEKPIESINKEVIKDCVINKIIPAIKARWPENASKVIKIQQDNARPHLKDNDPDFRIAATSDGFDIQIVHQPPNSPDTNINDLGWFRTIQSLQQETACKNIEELVNAVITSYTVEDAMKINKAFLTLQGCMVEILKIKGQNCYKVPHMGKDALIRAGMLPLNLKIESSLVKEALHHLIDEGSVGGIEDLGRDLGILLIPNMNA